MSIRIWIDDKTHRLIHVQENYGKYGTPTIYRDAFAFWKSEGKLILVTK